jgi:hypothetical protein
LFKQGKVNILFHFTHNSTVWMSKELWMLFQYCQKVDEN